MQNTDDAATHTKIQCFPRLVWAFKTAILCPKLDKPLVTLNEDG